MGYITNFIKDIFDVNISSMIGIPQIIIQVIVFVALMYVANMIYPHDKKKLALIAVVAALVAIFLV